MLMFVFFCRMQLVALRNHGQRRSVREEACDEDRTTGTDQGT
jgi:hypothetical protein